MDFGVGANLTGAGSSPVNAQYKQPVGEQSSDALDSTLPPVEQIDESAASKRITAERQRDLFDEIEQRQAKSAERNDQLTDRRIQEQVRELAKRDRDVKSHERMHTALAGRYAGAASYAFKKGPDGVLYAVGGSVAIDTSPIPGNPEATLRKAQVIKRAAMGPSDPSPADRAIASKASSMAANASADLVREMQQNRESIDAKKGSEQTAETVAVNTQPAEQSDLRPEEPEDNEILEEQSQAVDIPPQLIDAALNRKLVALGVFKDSIATGMVLDLKA